MSFPAFTVSVLEDQYTVLESPDRLYDGTGEGDVQVDHVDHVIWVAPGLAPDVHWQAVAAAVSQAWRERLREACEAWMDSHHVAARVIGSTEQV